MKFNIVSVSCLGCLGIGVILFGLILSAMVYVLPKGRDELYYDEEKNMYIKLIRTIDSDYGYVCLGKTMMDIETKSDCFKVDRSGNYASVDMLLSKSSDSIFVFSDSCEVINSTYYVITPIMRGTIQGVMIDSAIGDTSIIRYPDYDFDLRFKQQGDDYWRYFATWYGYWHDDGAVVVEDGYKRRETKQHRRLQEIKE